MKKFTQIIAVLLSVAFVTSCDLLKRDTFDGPDAEVTGRLLDAKTGDLINIEAAQVTTGSWWSQTTYNYGALVIMEQGWKDANGQPVSQEQHWFVRYDGHYTNNLVFAADYKVSMKLLPVYEPEKADFSLNKGSNTVDFSVIPFCRIINPAIKYDSGSKKIIATFSVELGDETKAKNITNVALCANTQLFVGCNYFNMAKNDKGAKKSNVNPGEEIVIGKDAKVSNVVIDPVYKEISRKHVSVLYDASNDIYRVTDYSSNGTWADGQKLTRNEITNLRRGTVLKLANDKNTFRLS